MNSEKPVVMEEMESVIVATNDVKVMDPIKKALVRDLAPVADRIERYAQNAQMMVVTNQEQAVEATAVCEAMAADVKIVKDHDVLSTIIHGLYDLKNKWTAVRDALITPIEASRKQLRAKVINWQEEERVKAEKEQRRLQAEADERARKERERLEKKADKVVTPEKKEEYLAAAAAVQTPVVHIEAPKTNMKGVAKVWKVKSFDMAAFLKAAAADPNLQGFIEVSMSRMERSKSALPSMTIPGVEFHQVIR